MSLEDAMLSVVSLFAGAGGMDVGLERAGWRTVFATDRDRDCIDTLRLNQARGLLIDGDSEHRYLADATIERLDVADLHASDIRPAGAGPSWRPALLAGGPPCQPWSSAGLQKGLADERGNTLAQFFRLADELKPSFILFENVRGMVTAVGPNGKPGGALEFVNRGFQDIGYATTFSTLNAANYGAAQRRVRLFMLAARDHRLPGFPEPTHSKNSAQLELEEPLKPWVSLAELLSTVERPDESEVVRPSETRLPQLVELRPGTGVRTVGRIENNRPSGHWGYRQDSFLADVDLPSRTIRTATTPDWIKLPDGSFRRLTWRECAALQGFPRDWEFSGKDTSKFRQIGNAVQADMVARLGDQLRASHLLGPCEGAPDSAPVPAEFVKRVRYTEAEHRVNGQHRRRVKVAP